MRRLLTISIAMSVTAAVAGQGPEVRNVMREKLARTHKILEAVVTSDWATLEAQSRALEQLTHDPRWTALRYPEYARYSAAFVRDVQSLHAAAERRDSDEAPKAYAAMTLQCAACHRYLARARIAH